MKKKSSKSFTPYVFILLLLIVSAVLNQHTNGSVLGRSYPPSKPDISALSGGTIQAEGVSLIVKEGTFDEDVYFRVDMTSRGNPISVQGLWQVSDIWEARVKYMSNNDQVTEFAAQNNYILSFPYTSQFLTTDQGLDIPSSSLKIIRGETVEGPWTVMANSVVDQSNKTVSLITNRGGFFMIAGGYYQQIEEEVSFSKKNQESGSTINSPLKTVILKDNEIVITLAPTEEYVNPKESQKSMIKSMPTETSEVNTKSPSNIFATFISKMQSFFQALLS